MTHTIWRLPALVVALLCVMMGYKTSAQTNIGATKPRILTQQERAELTDRWLLHRLENLVPAQMQKYGVQMWVLIGREYHEDPVLKTMLPATWLSARRRTILVFFDRGDGKGGERLSVSRYDIGIAGKFFRSAWNPAKEPNQFQRLVELIRERNPKTLAINRSATFAHADGLTATEYESFIALLPAQLKERIVPAENLCVAWLETRIDEEMKRYPELCQITHALIREGFSRAVITPGVTTTEQVEWWFRQKMTEWGLSTWFHPSVSIQRADPIEHTTRPATAKPGSETILAGDLLHVDIGISYLGLNSDVQQHAYICKSGETDVPEGIRKAFKAANRVQDIVTGLFKTGRTGNEILRMALEQCKKEGLGATIYSHPIGFHGHAAGPALGMWDNQGVVPGTGDYPINTNTAYSLELNCETPIPEWNAKPVRIMLEEDGFFSGDKEGFRYLNGRQQQIIIIR